MKQRNSYPSAMRRPCTLYQELSVPCVSSLTCGPEGKLEPVLWFHIE